MIYGHARVSTKTQEKDGNNLEAQEEFLCEFCAQEVYKDSDINKAIVEYKKNGGNFSRLTTELLKAHFCIDNQGHDSNKMPIH